LDIAINSQDKLFVTAENNGTIEVFDIDYILPTSSITCGNRQFAQAQAQGIPVFLPEKLHGHLPIPLMAQTL